MCTKVLHALLRKQKDENTKNQIFAGNFHAYTFVFYKYDDSMFWGKNLIDLTRLQFLS